ncbi:MAG: sulfotransferase [Crocinitomicaceae bacterium]|nr:sulfotransferase [Crocinitomicaceae bacterium]
MSGIICNTKYFNNFELSEYLMDLKIKTSSFINVFKHPLMGITFYNWMRVLTRNNFRIHLFMLPKVLFITGNTIFNLPFQLFEYLKYNGKVKRQKVVAPVFILGHPRSGTTYLHYLMSKDDQFAYCSVYDAILPHVFLSGGKVVKGMIASSLPSTRPQDEVKITIDSPKEEEFALASMSRTSFMFGFYFPRKSRKQFEESVLFSNKKSDAEHWKKHFDYFLKKLSLKYGNKRLLLKSPANTGRVKEILELYPDAKFIHIHRDPLEVYRSTVRLYEKIIPLTSFQAANKKEMHDYIINCYRLMYEKYLKDTADLPKTQLSSIEFKSLEKDPVACLRDAYESLGLKGFDNALEAIQREVKDSSDYKKNSYSEIDENKINRLKNEWGEVAAKLGYSI